MTIGLLEILKEGMVGNIQFTGDIGKIIELCYSRYHVKDWIDTVVDFAKNWEFLRQFPMNHPSTLELLISL
jgi:hypothetical protein